MTALLDINIGGPPVTGFPVIPRTVRWLARLCVYRKPFWQTSHTKSLDHERIFLCTFKYDLAWNVFDKQSKKMVSLLCEFLCEMSGFLYMRNVLSKCCKRISSILHGLSCNDWSSFISEWFLTLSLKILLPPNAPPSKSSSLQMLLPPNHPPSHIFFLSLTFFLPQMRRTTENLPTK